MKTLCLDIALRKTGVVMVEDGEISFYRTYTVPTKVRYHKALLYWYDTFKELYKGLDPDEVVVEDRLKRGFSGNTLASIEGARTASLIAWGGTGRFHLHDPAAIKKHLTGKHNAGKELVREAVLKVYPEAVNLTEDEIDALALYITHVEADSPLN